jgi:flagellar motor component MotA
MKRFIVAYLAVLFSALINNSKIDYDLGSLVIIIIFMAGVLSVLNGFITEVVWAVKWIAKKLRKEEK